ncbi:putative Upstream transcription factor 1 usf1 [Fasciola hepatica]|uniref:Upstream transcription factor 1 usf1 n=1 Tax=Fasciola hepatica TaxID=6192 RepID=A0A4E0RM53_FASHE|nr:putative Upstream transcription factor 1 usf1 [Fasciola hepatica]
MEQYDVYSSRVGLNETAISLPRTHTKLKRDKEDYLDDGIKFPAIKVPRQSLLNIDSVNVPNHSDPGSMSVLPRLLRTMANGSCRDPTGAVVNSTNNVGSNMAPVSSLTTNPSTTSTGVESGTLAAAAAAAAVASVAPGNPDTDSSSSSSSSSSSFISPLSSGSSSSSLISFLSPGGQLGPVASAVAAAAALSAPTNITTITTNNSHNQNTDHNQTNSLNTSVSDSHPGHDAPESSGLVTLATASSLIEQEWLARAAFASSASSTEELNHTMSAISTSCVNAATTITTSNTASVHVSSSSPPPSTNDLVALAVEHSSSDPGGSASPPLLFKTLTSTHSPQTQLNGSATTTPVTRAVLDFHSFAAFIRETQKQCSSRSTPTTPLELPLNSMFPASSTTNTSEPSQTTPPCARESRQCSPPRLAYSSTPVTTTTSTEALSPTQPVAQSVPGEALLIADALSSDGHCLAMDSSSGASQTPTAFISLQPAAGSILSSSDLHQLMASGEFMSSAARQTLLGQSPDGSTRQLYLLVPSDCPVIMSRTSANQPGSTTLTSAPSPLLNSTGATSAPILEAISPGVEPDESCDSLPPTLPNNHVQTITNTSQSVHVALPAQLAGAVLAPMSSATTTALSTLIAGLEVRSQPSQQSRYSNPTTAPVTWPTNTERANVQTTDSVLHNSSRVRLPLNIPGVTISESGRLLSTDHSSGYSNASTINGVSSLLGAIKSDPDMYTPNGHPYASLVEDVTRFRSYPTYVQSGTHQVPIASVRAAPIPTVSTTGATNTVFFQPDLSASLLLPPTQSTLVSTAVSTGGPVASGDTTGMITNNANGSANSGNSNGGGSNGGHLIQSNALSRTNLAFQTAVGVTASSTASSGSSSVVSVAAASPSTLMASNGKTNGQLDDCRRNMTGTLLSAAAAAVVVSTAAPNGNGHVDPGPATFLEHLNPESKDMRRRVSHNEVERRRRDRINTWISELYKLLPPDEQAKSQYQSKGVVLKRVCEYFQNVDSMLKAANAAVEQTRVENGLLRQRVHDLEQENQLLSASLQLGAAAAAVRLRHRQPRSAGILHSDETVVNGAAGVDGVATMKDSVDPAVGNADYPASVTVFTMGGNTDYGNANINTGNNGPSACTGTHTSSFTQAPPSAAVPISTNTGTGFTTNSVNNTGTGAPNPSSTVSVCTGATATAVFVSTPGTGTGSVLLNPNAGRPPTLTLPSLDMVANHSDARTD